MDKATENLLILDLLSRARATLFASLVLFLIVSSLPYEQRLNYEQGRDRRDLLIIELDKLNSLIGVFKRHYRNLSLEQASPSSLAFYSNVLAELKHLDESIEVISIENATKEALEDKLSKFKGVVDNSTNVGNGLRFYDAEIHSELISNKKSLDALIEKYEEVWLYLEEFSNLKKYGFISGDQRLVEWFENKTSDDTVRLTYISFSIDKLLPLILLGTLALSFYLFSICTQIKLQVKKDSYIARGFIAFHEERLAFFAFSIWCFINVATLHIALVINSKRLNKVEYGLDGIVLALLYFLTVAFCFLSCLTLLKARRKLLNKKLFKLSRFKNRLHKDRG